MVSTWTSEDDELLKNAIEAGTVEFPERFTLQEMKARWHSHTYYGNSSMEPSPDNVECEDSSSTLSPKLHNLSYKGEISGLKRKMNDDATNGTSSVVENRHQNQFMDSREAKQNHFETVIAAATTSNISESYEFEEAGHSVPKVTDQISEMPMFGLNDPFCSEAETLFEFNETIWTYGNNIDIGNFGDPFTLSQISSQETYESIFELTSCVYFHNIGDGNNYEFVGCDVHSNAMDQIGDNIKNLAQSTDGNSAGSAAPFMNLRDLEEFLLTDTDENDTANISGLDSFLLDFSSAVNIANVKDSSIYGDGACSRDDVNYGKVMDCWSESAMLTSTPAANPKLPTCFSNKYTSVPVANNVDPDLSELSNRVICCVLNTEDTEIPCNDDVLFIPPVTGSNPPQKVRKSKAFKVKKGVAPSAELALSSQCSSGYSRRKHQFQGILAVHLVEAVKEKPDQKLDSSVTIQSKKALHEPENNKENPDLSQTIQSKALYAAENIKEDPNSSQMIQSDILSELGINLPFIKRRD